MTRKLVLCDCLGTQNIDSEALASHSGLPCSRIYTNLCGAELEKAAAEMAAGDTLIACQQERQIFEELAAEIESPAPGFVDLRDRAGWADGDATAKMAALAAEAALQLSPGKSVDVISEGTCLVIGGQVALDAAAQLSQTLAVTVLLAPGEDPPTDRSYDCIRGQIRQASGALGGFQVALQDLQQLEPGGRGALAFGPAQPRASSVCDIILDLSGHTALFPAPEKREGYLRADPGHPPSVAQAIFDAAQLVGTFEKPLYIRLEETLCAHSRAEQAACSNCLNICPTSAITPAGEHVAIDPMVCAGCGSCAAVCPSGAITYDAPANEDVFRRLTTLAGVYRKAAGTPPRLLVHDAKFGTEMIGLLARYGRGLPVDVVPFEISALASFGHAEMLGALGAGFAQVFVLLGPATERDTIGAQAEIARAISGGRIEILDVQDPDALPDVLRDPEISGTSEPILPLGNRRQITRLAAKTLNPETDILPLPEASPYGTVNVDTDACTLCLSCVSLCPSGALGDNPDLPQLRFQEDACLQCGLCSNICPEQAITLEPRLNLSDAALTQRVLHEEEPFACVECGALFGVKSTVERIMEKLAGNHAMFATSDAARMIQMCDNCRIQAQYHSTDNPFQGGDRPRPRTTADYLSKRRDH